MSFPSQTSYAIDFSGAFAGMLGSEPAPMVESFRNDDASSIRPGVFLAQGTTNQSAILLVAASGAGGKIAGVSINTFSRDPGNVDGSLGTNDAYLPDASVPMLTQGSIWVTSESAFAIGDDVYVRHTANGGLTTKGAVTSGAGVTTGCRKLTGARVLQSSSASGVVLLSVNVDVDRATV